MDVVEMLMHFSLTKQEATIYKTLFLREELTGYEVAKLTGISRSNTYTALAGLVEKGAAYVVEDTATHYIPVRIDEFCDNKIKQMQEIRQSLIKNMPEKWEELEGYITIKGESHILDKMRTMIIEAKERVYLSLSEKPLEAILPQLNEAVLKGLKVVLITNPPFELAGAKVYHFQRIQHYIRLIVDSRNVLTGDIIDGDNCACLYSKKQNLVDLIKESLKNEIKLIELMS